MIHDDINEICVYISKRKERIVIDDDVVAVMDIIDKIIQSALEQDFSTLMKLRSDRYPDKETYLSCICSDVMLFFQFVNSKLNYIDCVSTDKSEIYTKLCWNYT